MAVLTWSRSRSSSVPGARPALRPARLISETIVCTITSSTRTRLSSCSYIARSSSSVGGRSCSLIRRSIGRPRLAHRLGVHLAQARPPVEAPPLGRPAVGPGRRHPAGVRAGGGSGPGHDGLERGGGAPLADPLEVDEAPVHAAPDPAPDVLLEQPPRR